MMWSIFSYAYLPSVNLWWGVCLGLVHFFKNQVVFLFLIFLIFSFTVVFSWAPSSENTQKALRSFRMIYFFKGKLLSFCFSPFTLVFQLYLPPLAEICLCVGQTVFPPLSLFYASTLLLDPQWQWRGTLVFNLLSHSQILCFQVINLCCPFTACCMLYIDW